MANQTLYVPLKLQMRMQSEVLDSNGTNVVSLRDILNSYNGTEYSIRPHQRCASHRFNNIMHADIESARRKVTLAYNNNDINEHVILGRHFFDSYDAIIRDCNKLWSKQQRSTVRILFIFAVYPKELNLYYKKICCYFS